MNKKVIIYNYRQFETCKNILDFSVTLKCRKKKTIINGINCSAFQFVYKYLFQ